MASGQFSLYVDAATGNRLARAQQLPLKIERNVKVVTSSSSQATVHERAVEHIGPLPEQVLQQQYVMSRTSMKNIANGSAYAYAPDNVTDRSPYYAINLPFDTGKGPYDIWKNEVGRAYTFAVRSGPR